MKRISTLATVFFLASCAAVLFMPGAPLATELVVGKALPWQMNFQPPATPVMERLENLHHYLLILICCITVFVLGLLAYVCVRFSRKNNPTPSKNTHNTLIEVIWTVVPVMILVGIAIPSLRLHYFMDRAVDPDMTLKITGYQW